MQSIDGLPFNSEGYEQAKNILKTNYENTSEIIRGYIDNINSLPVITGSQPSNIHKFCQSLSYNVQSGCLSMVRGILGKLPGIKSELVRGKVGWQDWRFSHLLQALEEWKEIHPTEPSGNANGKFLSAPWHLPCHRSFYAHHQDPAGPRACVYCYGVTHKSWECDHVKSPAERRGILQTKCLCFNCTKAQHNASQCQSRATCIHCKQRHHSSICDRTSIVIFWRLPAQ